MQRPEGASFEHLPGSDALKSSAHFQTKENLGKKAVGSFIGPRGQRPSFDNEAFERYIRMPKVIIDESEADDLIDVARTLENEVLPRYLNAAGWAYCEAALIYTSIPTVDRIELANSAERQWLRAIVNDNEMRERYGAESRQTDEERHRYALNLAFLPLVKSIIVGNVTEVVWESVIKDVSAIASDSAREYTDALETGNLKKVAMHKGLLYEANALLALLNIRDLRYVPMPSTARGGTGYYHREQTHDISIIHQHWGEIRKVIPAEVKSRAQYEDIHRYKALLIRGRMHLSIGRNSPDPRVTTAAFQAVVDGTATDIQSASVDRMSDILREMLKLYQRGYVSNTEADGGLTKFHDTKELARAFPEHAKILRGQTAA